jgi:hypothetical protein
LHFLATISVFLLEIFISIYEYCIEQTLSSELLAHVTGFGYENKWHIKRAKFNVRYHQSLLSHSLNVGLLSKNILALMKQWNLLSDNSAFNSELQRLSGDLEELVFLTGFLHDLGKDTEEFQGAVKSHLEGKHVSSVNYSHQEPYKIRPKIESLKTYLEQHGYHKDENFWEIVEYCIVTLGRRHDSVSALMYDYSTQPPSALCPLISEVVGTADRLLSVTLDELRKEKILSGKYTQKLDLYSTRVSVVRGITTQILLLTLEEMLKQKGYEPITWYQDGTVYCYKHGETQPIFDWEELKQRLKQKFEEIVFSDAPSLAEASFSGKLMQKVITEGNFLFYSDEVIEIFWKQRFNEYKNGLKQKGKKEDYFKKEGIAEDEQQRLMQEFNLATLEELHERLRRFSEFDFKVFQTLYGIVTLLKDLKAQRQEIDVVLEEKVYSKLGIGKPKSDPTHNMNKQHRLDFAEKIWKSPLYSNFKEWQSKLGVAMIEATKEFRNIFTKYSDTQKFIEERVDFLIEDITHPVAPGSSERLKMIYDKYLEGKTKGTNLCVLCNAPAEFPAQAELFGNSEIYSDFLAGGSMVGGENKLYVCKLCDFEFKLRRVIVVFRGKTKSFAIVPHIAISRESQLFCKKLAENLVYEKISPAKIGEIEFLQSLVNDEDMLKSVVLEVWNSYLKSKPTSPEVSELISAPEFKEALDRLINKYGGASALVEQTDKISDDVDADSLIELLRQGTVTLKQEEIRKIQSLITKIEPKQYTGNYVMVFVEHRALSKSEDDSSVEKLKWLLYQMILSKLFLATVFDITTSVVFDVQKKGYTPFSGGALFSDIEEKLNIKEGWVSIEDLDWALKKLSAAVLVEKILTKEDADYGNNTLLRVLRELRGRILWRYVQIKGDTCIEDLKKLIHALELCANG